MRIPKAIREVLLDGGHPALDFVNTRHDWVDAAARDYWSDPAALIAWHQHVGLIDPATADAFLALAPRAASGLLTRARGAREHLHTLLSGFAAHGRAPAAELAWLDQELARLAPFHHLATTGGTVAWQAQPDPAHPASLLGPALFQAAALLTGTDPARIKECPPPDGCGWLFLDTSRNGKRTWCSMATCGNTAKVRRFRSRQRG